MFETFSALPFRFWAVIRYIVSVFCGVAKNLSQDIGIFRATFLATIWPR